MARLPKHIAPKLPDQKAMAGRVGRSALSHTSYSQTNGGRPAANDGQFTPRRK